MAGASGRLSGHLSGRLSVTPATGTELLAAIPDLARLRMSVFRDFPYLYAGSAEYEERYLRTYAQAPGALVVLARDGGRVVGLVSHVAELKQRIPAQLHVLKGRAGSTVRFVNQLQRV